MNWIAGLPALTANEGSGKIIRFRDGIRVFLTPMLAAVWVLALTFEGICFSVARIGYEQIQYPGQYGDQYAERYGAQPLLRAPDDGESSPEVAR
ncbi:MAG: hypothetical protein ABIS18_03875 [Actinomycetota bacterium]